MKKITISIDKKTNEIKVEAFGYNGIDCKKDLNSLFEILKITDFKIEEKTNQNEEVLYVNYNK